ncbi:uncharacterized protein RAG0_11976 [Rhynchosporium agropyri]|uniref:Uncharacterized protein n=1 Tax=Rhynchosporium agropyri TaxID=914238 RepID=A0A1E1L952_9HELO|nr:uncharacterized protein RAG0_11976 [Rhynchosporium agropyri]
MAQGAVAVAPALTNGASLTAEELREILEYERIVQFRDAVMAGSHPRIKIPAHLTGKQNSRGLSSPISTTPRPNLTSPASRTFSGSRAEDSTNVLNKSPNTTRLAGGGHSQMSSQSEINPILLEKSDDLIKAELQLQRQRLERGLRAQIETQRIATKAMLQTSESLPNFDISKVLSQALAIAHPSTAPEVEPSAAASDSFDENTFYSSQHDTPELPSPVVARKSTAESQLQGAPSFGQRPHKDQSSQNQVENSEVIMTGTSLHNDNNLAKQPLGQLQHSQPQNSTLQPKIQRIELGNSESSSSSCEVISTHAQGTVNVSYPSNGFWPDYPQHLLHLEDSANLTRMQTTTRDLLKRAFDNTPASPLLRVHNLSPLAPQPARVSPLATARDPPILRERAISDGTQPVQVSTLRNQATGISSTDSSPKGKKTSERRKEKKEKKRKRRGKETAGTPESPYIKPEPHSPSPYTAVAPLPRPQKRQRKSGQYAAELNYDEPEDEQIEAVQERIPEQHYREVRAPRIVEREDARYEPDHRRIEPEYRRVEREPEAGYRRVADGQYERRPQSPIFALPYAPGEVRQVRAASHAIVERRAYDESRYYREPVVRASVRPDVDRERSRSPVFRERRSPIPMAPPSQSMRIVIDEFGRKYYEPQPPASVRYREPEIIYERAPTRAVSSRNPAEFEEDGVVYRRASPPVAVPRRVVTQPEYASGPQPDFRQYRQREYSVRPTPMGPPGEEYIQIRSRQLTPEIAPRREYIPRAASVFPEPVRYEIPREYARIQSVRPEGLPREYATSAQSEVRREMVPQSQREYSVRPMDTPLVGIPQAQRGYSVRPMSVRPMEPPLRREPPFLPEGARYYDEPISRQPAEVAFIERPRARESSVMVYTDDARREVYR